MTATLPTSRRAPASSVGARRRVAVLLALIGAVVVSVVLSVSFGSRPVSLSEIVEGMTLWVRGETPTGIGAIAVQSRVPRTIMALLAGAALALSGTLMQAITRNPLADPGLYARDPAGFDRIMKASDKARSDLAAAEEEWLALEEKREALGG